MQKQEAPVAWLTDRQSMYFDKEDALRDCDGFIQPLYTRTTPFVGLTQPEIDEIITDNITITNHQLRDAIEAVVVDIEITLMEKNT